MQMIEISKLTPHSRNNEFFDDINGDKWEDFKKSVVRRGVVEGVVVTQDLVIVSGHQRVRACKELGILAVPCRITHYPDNDPQTGNPKEDMILEDLISTNILQRGIGNVNPMKMARCIVELERIYGIRQGGDRKSSGDNLNLKTQSDLASELNVSQRQLNDYKKLNELIPELQELVESNQLKATTSYKIWAKMPKDEQEKFFNEIGKNEISKMTQKQTEEYIKLQQEVELLKSQLDSEKNKPVKTEIITVEKEVIPEHIHSELDRYKKALNSEKQSKEALQKMIGNLEQEKIKLEQTLNSDEYQLEQKKKQEEALKYEAHVSMFDLQIKIQKFLDQASPSLYLQGAMAYGDRNVRKELIESVKGLEMFVDNLKGVLQVGTIKNVNENSELIIDMEVK